MVAMSKIFIDCGGNNGCSVIKFRSEYDQSSEYKIYTFEPNPKFFNCYLNFKNHQLIKKLVWIENSFVDFYIDNSRKSPGSTALKQKTIVQKWCNYTILKVESIDFSLWLNNNFKSEDEIILKMDIEGAEYDVLNKMFQDKTIQMIKKLFIEWHRKKIGISRKVHNNVLDKVKEYVSVQHWDALRK